MQGSCPGSTCPGVNGRVLDWPLSQDEKRQYMLQLFEKDVRTANFMLANSEAEMKGLRKELDSVHSCRKSVSSWQSPARRETSSPDMSARLSGITSANKQVGKELVQPAPATPRAREGLEKKQEFNCEELEQLHIEPQLSLRRHSVAEPEPDPSFEVAEADLPSLSMGSKWTNTEADLSMEEGGVMPPLPSASSKGLPKAVDNIPLSAVHKEETQESAGYMASPMRVFAGCEEMRSASRATACWHRCPPIVADVKRFNPRDPCGSACW